MEPKPNSGIIMVERSVIHDPRGWQEQLASSRPSSPTTAIAINDGMEEGSSGDSLTHSVSPLKSEQPAAKKKRTPTPAGLQGHRLAPPEAASRPPVPPRKGARSSSSGAAVRAAGRSTTQLPQHELKKPENDSAEAWLKCLVLQQKTDHDYLQQLGVFVQDTAAAAQADKLEKETLANATLGLRREVYAIRDDQARELPQRVDAGVRAGIQALLEDRVSGIETSIEQLRQAQVHNAALQNTAADYIEQLHGVRPSEGNIVMAGFKFLNDATLELTNKVHQLELFNSAAGSANTVGPQILGTDVTSKINAQILEVNSRVKHMENVYPAINNLMTTVSEHSTKVDYINAWSQRLEHEIAAMGITIWELSSAHPGPGHVQCGACDGNNDDGIQVGRPLGQGAAPAPRHDNQCAGACCSVGSLPIGTAPPAGPGVPGGLNLLALVRAAVQGVYLLVRPRL